MSDLSGFRSRLFELSSSKFEDFALEIFHWQASCNPLYKEYVSYLRTDTRLINRLEDVPFLPIEFFKRHMIKTGEWLTALTFSSSGTTGMAQSKHLLDEPGFYDLLTKKIFENAYGPLNEFHIVALLPSYLDREGSSLIHMVDYFIRQSGSSHSGFFLRDDKKLLDTLDRLKEVKGAKLLIGVTFALIELAQNHEIDLSDFIVMETGGMKGRGRELTRDELHKLLMDRFNVASVHSEYGMTELMSQAYSNGGQGFAPPFSMKVLVRDVNDPFMYLPEKKIGGLNIIDLANLHSCAFIETKDLGQNLSKNGNFEVLGRFDNSDVRGCNLLVQ